MQEWKKNTSLGELLEGDHNMDREGNDERCKSMDDLVGPILAYIEWGWHRLIGFCKAGLSLVFRVRVASIVTYLVRPFVELCYARPDPRKRTWGLAMESTRWWKYLETRVFG